MILGNLAEAKAADGALAGANAAVKKAEAQLAEMKEAINKQAKDHAARQGELGLKEGAANSKHEAEIAKANADQAKKTSEVDVETRITKARSGGDELAALKLERDRDLEKLKKEGVPEQDALDSVGAKYNAKIGALEEKKKAIDEEIKLNEAKADGNTLEVKRLEWLKEYARVYRELSGVKGGEFMGGEADATARRAANAQPGKSAELPQTKWITASSSGEMSQLMARLSGGTTARTDGERTVDALQKFQSEVVSGITKLLTKPTDSARF